MLCGLMTLERLFGLTEPIFPQKCYTNLLSNKGWG